MLGGCSLVGEESRLCRRCLACTVLYGVLFHAAAAELAVVLLQVNAGLLRTAQPFALMRDLQFAAGGWVKSWRTATATSHLLNFTSRPRLILLAAYSYQLHQLFLSNLEAVAYAWSTVNLRYGCWQRVHTAARLNHVEALLISTTFYSQEACCDV